MSAETASSDQQPVAAGKPTAGESDLLPATGAARKERAGDDTEELAAPSSTGTPILPPEADDARSALESDSERLERDSDRLDSTERGDDTPQPHALQELQSLTAEEPTEVAEISTDPVTEVAPETETATNGGSLYPGQMKAVRAPGWDGGVTQETRGTAKRHRPASAPELQPASVPNLHALPADLRPPTDEGPALTPIDETEHDATPPQRRRRDMTAVDFAAKELARAALAAEIEKEEKKALRHYQLEDGEIPPSPEVAKRFDVILQLGKGGMAIVYLCRDPRQGGKIVAVKDIRAEMKPGMKVEQRVEHEANLLKELDHPGIVKVFDLMKFPRGSAIVMEYIDGLPLDHEIGAGRRISWEFGVRILREIGAALLYAHEMGVIHRDIKPDNILWSERHNVMKLVDFGLARIFGDETEVHMTRTGMVVGTPHYMSPEQVSGKPLDQRSDVYSFGATIYYLLTGQRHVEGSNVMEILEQQRSRDIKPPSHTQRDVPAWLSYIVGKMMEIKPDDRYQQMAEVLADISLAEIGPDSFLRRMPRGRVKRYGDLELSLGPAPAELEQVYLDESERIPSAQMEIHGGTSVQSHSQPAHESTSDQVALAESPAADSPQQISALLQEISGRLAKAEQKTVSPGLLVLLVMLSTLVILLAIIGALLFAHREGYLVRLLNL